jgi:hypothetical protein
MSGSFNNLTESYEQISVTIYYLYVSETKKNQYALLLPQNKLNPDGCVTKKLLNHVSKQFNTRQVTRITSCCTKT